MKKIGFLVALMMAACSSSPPNTTPPDAAAKPDSNSTPADAGLSVKKCDPEAQTGCSGSTPKCSTTGSSTLTPSCTADGTGNAGDSCTRTGNMVGVDDCMAGLFCSGVGFPVAGAGQTQMRECRAFCGSDSDCAPANADAGVAASWCVGLTNLNPPDGFCIEGCDLFSGGSQCTGKFAGETCEMLIADVADTSTSAIVHAACRASTSTAKPGDTCMRDEDCAAGSVCYPDFSAPDGGTPPNVCQVVCDNNNPCAGSATCSQFFTGGGFNGIGLCLR